MPKTLGSSAAASAPGWLQAAVEGVAEEGDLPISLPNKQALMKVSWASLAVRGECAVELGWALGHTTGGGPATASEELAAGRRGTPRVPASPSWCSAHPWPGWLPRSSAQCAADHRSLLPSFRLFQPLHHVFPDQLFPGSQDQLFPGSPDQLCLLLRW